MITVSISGYYMVLRKDVANLAGVSQSSVSYYINSNGYVSAKAGKRIQKAIDELGYTPNQIARSLKIKDSKQFLFFCNEIRNSFYSEIVYCATMSAKKVGYTIMFTCVVDDDKYIKKMCGYQISGVFTSNSMMKLEHINEMAKRNIPIVMLRDIKWNNIDPSVTQIKIDYSYIMQDICNHLKSEGYKNIVYISGSHSAKKKNLDEKTKSFLKENGNNPENVIYGILNAEDAYSQVVTNYSKANCPDAFACTNDVVAMGVMKGISDIGLKPSDIGIVGFDNSLSSKFVIPTLSTVDIKMKDIGNIVIDSLMKKLEGGVVEDYIIQPKLIIRQSSTRS